MHDDAVNDRLDGELTQLLRVNPSQEFVAGIRRRVAAGPVDARSWPSVGFWSVAVAGAAALVLIVLARGRGPAPVSGPDLTARSLTSVNAPLHDGTASTFAARGVENTVRTLPVRTETARPSASGSDILVDRDEARATRQVLEGIRRGRVDSTALAAISTVMDAPPLREIEIVPIDLPRLAGGDDKGVQQ
jgi:hypothetical protein